MSRIKEIKKQTSNHHLNLYELNAQNRLGGDVRYFVASRAEEKKKLKIITRNEEPDGVIIYSLYGEKRDKVVLIRQYRYSLDDYIYEFPAGLVEPGEDFHDGAVREMYEETGLKFEPLEVNPAFEKPFFPLPFSRFRKSRTKRIRRLRSYRRIPSSELLRPSRTAKNIALSSRST